MEITGVMIFACAAAILAGQLKFMKSGIESYIVLTAGLIIIFYILGKLEVVIAIVEKLQSYVNIQWEYIEVMLKIVGISYITQFASDMCKDCGYGTIAGQIQIFGKLAVVTISMPIVLALIETVVYILG